MAIVLDEQLRVVQNPAKLDLKLTTYEQIRIVFNRRHHWHGVYRVVLSAAGDDHDDDGSR